MERWLALSARSVLKFFKFSNSKKLKDRIKNCKTVGTIFGAVCHDNSRIHLMVLSLTLPGLHRDILGRVPGSFWPQCNTDWSLVFRFVYLLNTLPTIKNLPNSKLTSWSFFSCWMIPWNVYTWLHHLISLPAMSVPYMLAFPAFGSLVSSIPPILVSMAGYILVFAAFLLVITIFFIARNFQLIVQLWPGWAPFLSSHRTFSSLNRGLAKTLTVMLACLTNISSASLPLQSPGGPGRNRYWHCSNPCRNFCSCATVSFFFVAKLSIFRPIRNSPQSV